MRLLIVCVALLCAALGPVHCQETDTNVEEDCIVSVVINALGGLQNPFNALAVVGGTEVAELRGCQLIVWEPPTSDDYVPFMGQAVTAGSDVIVSVGFDMADQTFEAAELWPNATFAIVDWAYSVQLPNLVGIIFREDQSGFLVGMLVGAMPDEISTLTGCLGGIPSPPVLKFCNGYRQGVLEECTKCSVLQKFVFSFTDVEAGQEAAREFLANDTRLLFGAGGRMGSAGILEFSKSRLVIGVDADEYFSTFLGGEIDPEIGDPTNLITSALKRVEVAVRITMLEVLDGVTTSGTRVFDAAAGGIGYAPCHEGCSHITEEAQIAVDLGLEQLAQGILITGVDQFTGFLTLYVENNTQQWLKLLPTGHIPPAFYGHSLNSFDNNSVALMFGGQSSTVFDTFEDDIYIFDYPTNAWLSIDVVGGIKPTPRSNHIALVYNEDWLIVYGGNGVDDVIYTDTWVFRYSTSTWRRVETSADPNPRTGFAAAIAENTLYIYGGTSDSGILLGDIWSLDLTASIPEAQENAPAVRRQNAAWNLVDVQVVNGTSITDQDGPIILERRDHRAAANDTRVFFFGGELSSFELTNEVLLFDTIENTIRRIAGSQELGAPPPVKGHAITKFGNDVYIFGGVSAQSVFNSVYRFNLFNFDWTLLATTTSFAPPAMTAASITPIVDNLDVNATRLVIYGGLSTNGAEQVLYFFGIPENPIEFLEWFSCKDKDRFFAPSGSIDFVPTGDNDIYPISYRCDGFVDCDNLFDESTSCSPSVESIFIAFTVILSFLFLFTFFLIGFLFKYRKDKTVVTASQNFLFVSVIGAQLAYASLFMFFFKRTDSLCAAQIWLLALGFITMFAPLLVKTYRIVKVFRTRNFFLKPLSDLELFGRLILLYVPVLILLLVIQFHGEPEARLAKEPGDNCEESKFHMLCKTEGLSAVAAVLIVYYASLLIVGVVFAIMTRHVQTAFNESQYIALAIYNFFFLGSVGVPMFYLLDEQPEVRLIILCLLVSLASTVFLGLLFFPKMYIISVGGQDAYDQKTADKSVTVKTDPGTAFDD